MNKKVLKVLAPSLLAVLAAGGVTIGATYALFTSNAKTNIAITAGKVNVTSTLSELKTYSGIDLTGDPAVDVNYTDDLGGAFSNGGSATITDGNLLTIEKMTPGDKVTFALTTKNNSNVKIKWRISYQVISDDGLVEALKISINDEVTRVSKLKTNTDWIMPLDGQEYIDDITVEMPSDKGNVYQEKSCSIRFLVEAVQANAFTRDINLEIANKADLLSVREDVNSGYDYGDMILGLVADIDLAGETWSPIGTSAKPFAAEFEGNDNEIKNLTIASTEEYTGLFGVIDEGIVRNLVLSDVNVSSTDSDTGALAGRILRGAEVDNVKVTSGTVSGVKRTGGLVGSIKAEGSIKNCENKATVTSTNYNIGGIVGAAYYVEAGKEMLIEKCVNEGAVTGASSNAGGITGLSTAVIKDCVNKGAITANGGSLGGIAGEQKMIGSITGCINEGAITNNLSSTGAYGTGGIVGWVRYPDAIGSAYAAAAIITVSNNVNKANVKGSNDAGGIIGTVYNSAIVKNNKNENTSNKAITFAAGIVGNYQYCATFPLPELEANFVITDNEINVDTVNDALCTDPICYDNTK